MNKLNSFLLILSIGLNACGIDKSDDQIIQKLKEDFINEHIADEPCATVSAIAQEAVKACNITEPIIFLQTDSTDNAFAKSKPYVHPQKFIIIGTKKQDLSQIRSAIYHELGHIAHHDTTLERVEKDVKFAQQTRLASFFTGLGATLIVSRYLHRPWLGICAGASLGIGTLMSGAMMSLYEQRNRERKADIFAYENLVKHGHLNDAIDTISDYLYKHEFNYYRPLPIALCDHPHDIERAKIGLDVLQKQGVNIPHLIKNLPHDLNDGIKKHFPDQVQRFFPEFCVEKQEELK